MVKIPENSPLQAPSNLPLKTIPLKEADQKISALIPFDDFLKNLPTGQLQSFVATIYSNPHIDPCLLAKLQSILTQALQKDHLHTHLEHYPTFSIEPQILSKSKISALNQFMCNPTPEKQWYGRATYWQEQFKVSIDATHNLTFHHTKDHPANVVIDRLASSLLQTMVNQGVDLKKRKAHFEVYVVRNEVKKDQHSPSSLFWHRDRMTLNGREGIEVDYSMVYLLSDHHAWKGGDMLLQRGGEPISRRKWKNSNEPILRLRPRFNQAIIFKNSDAAHMVEDIVPIEDMVKRDVVVLTCVFEDSKSARK